MAVSKHTFCGKLYAAALAAMACLASLSPAAAQTGRFDLLGPQVEVHVARGDQSLPIASVPNLLPGDKLQVHADLPATQSVHLLLVIAFLRGSTNPPPDTWFTRIETWNRHAREEGVTVVVPSEAEQALIFIAPETGGDFSTLKSAVRGRPGIFVRAAQDLNEASFEQSRIERYVQALQRVPGNSPEELADHSRKLAATLNLRPNDDCYKRPSDAQLACLRQSGSALLLDDGHGQNLAQMLSTGPTSDLIGAVAGTPVATQGGAGSYSAYVGTVLDVVRLLTGLHTAKYQYIPAIAFPDGDSLNLRLNTAPSFHDPKSVIVIGLPSIQKAVPPPLKLQNAHHISCLLQPRMVLPLAGAPLVFATSFAHDLTLHLDHPGPDGRTDLPLVPSAYEGGLIVSAANARKPLAASAPEPRDATGNPSTSAAPDHASSSTSLKISPAPADTASSTVAVDTSGPVEITGTVRGFWGFDKFDGPTLPLQRIPGKGWVAAPHSELFAGRLNTLLLRSDGTSCTKEVDLANATPTKRLDWTPEQENGAREIAVKLPLEKTSFGGLTVAVHQYGEAAPQGVAITAYSDETRVQTLRLYAGDNHATLVGTGLAEVKSMDLNGIPYLPAADTPGDGKLLHLDATATGKEDLKGKSKATVFKAGDHGSANIALKDGRTLPVTFQVDAARPAFTILSKSLQPEAATGMPLVLGDKDDLPLNAKLTVALRSDSPVKFPRTEKVEISTTDGTLDTRLSLADRNLVLQDSHTALAYLTPSAVFGPSAFGPLQIRVVAEGDTFSDWQPLGLLVRTPTITAVSCATHTASDNPQRHAHGMLLPTSYAARDHAPRDHVQQGEGTGRRAEAPCQLTGSSLFLIDSAASNASFDSPVSVPAGYTENSLAVPRPADGHTLYFRLRDDPDHIASFSFEPLDHRVARSAAP